MATVKSPMTTDELLAIPEDGTDRWLIAGEMRERPITPGNRFHSCATTRISKFLDNWLDTQPSPRGQDLGGEAGIILRRDPDTFVGVDVAYVNHEVMARQSDETTQIEGVPTLIVEVLSPSDTIEEIDEKLEVYRTAGVPLVWLVDPRDRTVTVYRPDAEPELFNSRQHLTAEPDLPGFEVAVALLFE